MLEALERPRHILWHTVQIWPRVKRDKNVKIDFRGRPWTRGRMWNDYDLSWGKNVALKGCKITSSLSTEYSCKILTCFCFWFLFNISSFSSPFDELLVVLVHEAVDPSASKRGRIASPVSSSSRYSCASCSRTWLGWVMVFRASRSLFKISTIVFGFIW